MTIKHKPPKDTPRSIAITNHSVIYFGGRPCRKDASHDKGRYTENGSCVVCAYETNLRIRDSKTGVKRQKEVLKTFNQFRAFMFGDI